MARSGFCGPASDRSWQTQPLRAMRPMSRMVVFLFLVYISFMLLFHTQMIAVPNTESNVNGRGYADDYIDSLGSDSAPAKVDPRWDHSERAGRATQVTFRVNDSHLARQKDNEPKAEGPKTLRQQLLDLEAGMTHLEREIALTKARLAARAKKARPNGSGENSAKRSQPPLEPRDREQQNVDVFQMDQNFRGLNERPGHLEPSEEQLNWDRLTQHPNGVPQREYQEDVNDFRDLAPVRGLPNVSVTRKDSILSPVREPPNVDNIGKQHPHVDTIRQQPNVDTLAKGPNFEPVQQLGSPLLGAGPEGVQKVLSEKQIVVRFETKQVSVLREGGRSVNAGDHGGFEAKGIVPGSAGGAGVPGGERAEMSGVAQAGVAGEKQAGAHAGVPAGVGKAGAVENEGGPRRGNVQLEFQLQHPEGEPVPLSVRDESPQGRGIGWDEEFAAKIKAQQQQKETQRIVEMNAQNVFGGDFPTMDRRYQVWPQQHERLLSHPFNDRFPQQFPWNFSGWPQGFKPPGLGLGHWAGPSLIPNFESAAGVLKDDDPPEDYTNTSLTPLNPTGGISVYSAYHDDRLVEEPTVRMIMITNAGRKKKNVTCHFAVPETTTAFSVAALPYEMCENHHKKFLGFIFSCPLPTALGTKRYNLSLSTNNNAKVPVTPLYVTPDDVREGRVSEEKHRYRYNFSVCVSPLFGSVRAKTLVEFVELTRLLGVEHVFFYDHHVSELILRVLKYYQDKGWVTVLPWKLPTAMDIIRIWYHGQLVANNDCLYRSMAVSKYTTFHDFDELIVPHSDDARTLNDLVPPDGLPDDTCGYSFQSAFFDPGVTKGEFPDDLMTVALTARTYKLSKVRSKVLVQPRRVFEVGIHHVSKQLEERWEPRPYNSSKAFLHHYRECIKDYGMRCDNWVNDTVINDRFMPQLKENFQKAVKELMLL